MFYLGPGTLRDILGYMCNVLDDIILDDVLSDLTQIWVTFWMINLLMF